MINNKNIYTVAQLNSYIKNMFEQDYLLPNIFVKGEVSNCKYHSSGHIYFTLKDPKGCINCVMFAGNRAGLSFRLEEGMGIVVYGSVDVYEKSGTYQIYAKQITPDGSGALYERYEKLKKDLEERGMFAAEYKQPIPKYVKTLGVVTAETGAAVRDIIQIAKRRNPYVQIVLYPALVQGEGAAESIAKGIRALEKYGVDVMIVGRGGGSIEDLWAYNEEIVAQAVFDCSIPIISAVGHETDTTITDYVADLRAPTPSAAAELAVCDIKEVFDRIDGYKLDMSGFMDRVIRRYKNRLEIYEVRIKNKSPENRLNNYKTTSLHLEEGLEILIKKILSTTKHRLEINIEKLNGLSPLSKLSAGFSYAENEKGENIKSVLQVRPDEIFTLHVKDGRITGRVTDVKAEDEYGLK